MDGALRRETPCLVGLLVFLSVVAAGPAEAGRRQFSISILEPDPGEIVCADPLEAIVAFSDVVNPAAAVLTATLTEGVGTASPIQTDVSSQFVLTSVAATGYLPLTLAGDATLVVSLDRYGNGDSGFGKTREFEWRATPTDPGCPFLPEPPPLGTDLSAVADWSSEQPFVDAFKASRPWITQCVSGQEPDCVGIWDTGESALLDLDADGWVRTLPAPEDAPVYWFVGTLMFREIGGHYPGGQYVVSYDGEGTLEYGFDAVKDQAASAPGRDVLTVTPSDAGIYLKLTATDPAGTGNHLRNIRVVQAQFETSVGTQPFSPALVSSLAPYAIVRFLNWMRANHSLQEHWVDRPLASDARYTTPDGVPLEVMLDLVNLLDAEPWFTIPHMATDDYVEQFATVALAQLGPDQRVYVEYSNEVWNGAFAQGTWVEQQAEAQWPGGATGGFTKRINWHGMRTAQVCQIWKNEWGTEQDRVICVLGSQASNDWVGSQALDCPLWIDAPCSAHGISALAIGPYFGRYLGTSENEATLQGWLADADGGLGRLFDELFVGGEIPTGPTGGALQQATDFMMNNLSVATSRSVGLLAYEGGQHLVGIGAVADNVSITDLLISANRDPRMGQVYAQYLASWEALGGGAFVHFLSADRYTKWGSWGALEYLDQPTSPKYDALVDFSTGP